MAGFIMAGRMQAAIFVVLSTLISLVMPPLIVFSSAAIALITLRQGWQQGILYTILAIVVLMLVSTAIHQQPSSALLAGLATWLPMVVTASVLAMTTSWSKTLQLVLLFATVGVLLFHFIHPDATAYWTTVMEKLKPLLKQNYQQTDKQIDEMVNNISSWMTGTFAATFALITIVSLIIARNWQAMLYNSGGFSEEFRQIALGKQAALIFLVGTALAVVSKNHLIIELIMVGIVIFMFQGLSLVHALVKQYQIHSGWLFGLYVLIFVLFVQMIVLLATFGVIDNFVDFRRKKTN